MIHGEAYNNNSKYLIKWNSDTNASRVFNLNERHQNTSLISSVEVYSLLVPWLNLPRANYISDIEPYC